MADRSLLARATEGTQAPTPGYLYLDIAKNVASSPMACQEVATYLTRRLQSKQNANIKYKCLKVIAKVAESPVTKGIFKRTMAQDSEAMSHIKEALQFRGPPDPARGDEPYQKVRTAAKEAMDAIYSDAPTSNSAFESSYGRPVAASGAGASSMGTSSSSSRMEGIGNPMFKDPRLDQSNQSMTAETFLRDAGEAIVGMIKDPLARNVDYGPSSSSSSNMPGYGSGSRPPTTYPPGRSQLAQSTGGEWTMASNRGPAAVNPPANFHRDEAYYKQKQAYDWASKSGAAGNSAMGGVGGSWGAPPSALPPSVAQAHAPHTLPTNQPYIGITSAQTTRGHGGTAVSDGQYEKQLIMELCPPGGLKAEPPPDKLQRFAQAIQSLDADLVCPALLDCLEEGQPWIIRAKALCVMETCISVGVGEDGVNKYADFFYECRGEIEPLSRHARPAVRDPARRVMELLGVATSGGSSAPELSAPPPPNHAFAPPAPAAAPPPDLLDFGDAAPSPAAPPPPVPPSPPAAESGGGGGGSLFGGLKVQSKASVASPAPQSTAVSSVESLLGEMTVQETPATASTAFPFMQASETLAPAPAEGSAFGFMQESSAPPPPPAAGSSFSFMQSSDIPPAPSQAASETEKQAGSAFGFMQSETTISSPNPTKPTFDPLAQNYQPSPTSQRPTMMAQQQALTPAQLQAMYAQQLMMQQQMQQMQLAMAMQASGGGGVSGGVGMMSQGAIPRNPNVMVPGGYAATNSFSFLDKGAQPQKKKQDKQFDFVQDAIKKEQK